jgi:hypothetical protein
LLKGLLQSTRILLWFNQESELPKVQNTVNPGHSKVQIFHYVLIFEGKMFLKKKTSVCLLFMINLLLYQQTKLPITLFLFVRIIRWHLQDDLPTLYWILNFTRIYTEKDILPILLLVQQNKLSMTKILSAVKEELKSYCDKV